jgi:peroxiredoxin Q/BCP
MNCQVFGISRDSLKSHEKFRDKLGLPFDLISDSTETACSLYGVIKMKNMYGKQVRGIERSTFVIDSRGIVRKEVRGVKVPGHAQAILEFVRGL